MSEGQRARHAQRILYVEDDPDVREVVGDMLAESGANVRSTDSAERALELLQRERFDLVVADYNLPGQSGGWLLDEAQRLGLLRTTRAMIVTAHSRPAEGARFEVHQKPLDLVPFLERVAELLDEVAPEPRVDRPKVSLRLYVSGDEPSSARAEERVRELLLRAGPAARASLEIIDVGADPLGRAAADKIAVTPTLVLARGTARHWFVGDVRRAQELLALLED